LGELPSVFPQNMIETELFTGLLSRKKAAFTQNEQNTAKINYIFSKFSLTLTTITLFAPITTGCRKICVL